MPAEKAVKSARTGRLSVLLCGLAEAAVFVCALTLAHPAAAQVVDERFPQLQDRRNRMWQPQPQWQQPQWQQPQQQPQQQPYSPFQAFPDQQRQPRQVQVDPTRPPPPKPPATPPTVNVAVFGDAIADWLAFGLEEAFAETPEIGILRKARAQTGLIRIETRNESFDWPQQARDMLAADKPDYVVMMIGLSDRRGIREKLPAPPRNPAQKAPVTPPQSAQKGPATSPPPAQQNPQQAAAAPKPAPERDAEAPPPDTAPQDDQQTPEPDAPSAGSMVHEFRTDKWGELYSRRIDETIAVLKSRGVPVFWVGLPSIRGTRATSEMVYLNDLFRARAEKAGIVYIDIWDGFVDDAGNFSQYGADFEGQTRRLRTGDGVNFTRYGARKLAHYVEREIRRVMQARALPVATPLPEPEPEVKGPQQAAKPIASPVMSLTAPAQNGDTELLGAAPIPAAKADSVAARVLVRGEPVEAPPGRADDFAWPRRDVATATGALPPDPVLPPPVPVTPPAPVAAAPAITPRSFAVAPNPQRVQQQQQQQQQRTTDSWWRPFAQQPEPQRQQRTNRDNTPSFFGNWFGR